MGKGGGKKYCRKRMTVWRDEIGPDEILAGCQRWKWKHISSFCGPTAGSTNPAQISLVSAPPFSPPPSLSLSLLFLFAHFTRELAFRFRTIPGRSGNPSSLSFQMFPPPNDGEASDDIFCIVRRILMHPEFQVWLERNWVSFLDKRPFRFPRLCFQEKEELKKKRYPIYLIIITLNYQWI